MDTGHGKSHSDRLAHQTAVVEGTQRKLRECKKAVVICELTKATNLAEEKAKVAEEI